MSQHPLEESMLLWGLIFALLMILFYIGFTLWMIVVIIHDKVEQRKEIRNARKRRAQNNNQG
jgi:cell division protein FtsB